MNRFCRKFALTAILAASLVSTAKPALADDETPLMGALKDTSTGRFMEANGLRLSGWIEGSAMLSDKDVLLPRGFDYLGDNGSLQQNWVRFERTTDPVSGRTFGFRSDWIAPGTDYRFTLARGVFDQQLTDNDGAPNRYGFDPVQFYFEAQPEAGTVLKLGRFFAPYGVESIEGWSTPLVSRSYTFIYNPFTQTGLLLTLPLTQQLTLTAAATAGNDVFIDDANNPTFDLGLSYTPPEGTAAPGADSAAIFFILGESRFDTEENFNNPAIVDLVYEHRFTEEFRYSVEAIAGLVRDVPEVGTASWFGAANYFRYQVTPEAEAIARVEAFNDEDGNRTGSEGTYFGYTAGITYKPMPWLMLRPEVRYDHHTENGSFEGTRDQTSATMDVLVRW